MSMGRSHISILEDIRLRALEERRASSLVALYGTFLDILRELSRTQPHAPADNLHSQAEFALFSRYWPDELIPFRENGLKYKLQFPLMYNKAKGDCELRFTREHKRLTGNFKEMERIHGPDFCHYRLEQLMWEALWPKEQFPGINPIPPKTVKQPTPSLASASPQSTNPNHIKVASRLPKFLSAAIQSMDYAEKASPELFKPGPTVPRDLARPTKVVQQSPSQTPHPLFGSQNPFSSAPVQHFTRTSIQPVSPTQVAVPQPQQQQPITFADPTPLPPQTINSATMQIAQTPMQNVSTQTETTPEPISAMNIPPPLPESPTSACLAKINSFLETLAKDYTNLKPLSTALHCQLRIEQLYGSVTYPLRVFVEPQIVRVPPDYTQAVVEANRARRMLSEWGRRDCDEVWKQIAEGWQRDEFQGREENDVKRKRV